MSNKRTIRGYTCEMLPNDDRPGNNCYISKGRYSASLACASDNGYLTDASDNEAPISQEALDAIEEWALANGY